MVPGVSFERVILLSVMVGVESRAEACLELNISDEELQNRIDQCQAEIDSGEAARKYPIWPPSADTISEESFLGYVRTAFDYLFTKYGFSFADDGKYKEEIYQMRSFHRVIVQSPHTRIVIWLSDFLSLDLHPLTPTVSASSHLPSNEPVGFDLLDIITWATRSEKTLRYTWPDNLATDITSIPYCDVIRAQLNEFAAQLLRYAEPFLRGDYSRLHEIRPYIFRVVTGQARE
jgi:hypothetical protein